MGACILTIQFKCSKCCGLKVTVKDAGFWIGHDVFRTVNGIRCDRDAACQCLQQYETERVRKARKYEHIA